MKIIKEIEVKNYPKNNTPIIRVFDDGTSYLLIDDIEEIFSDNDLEEELCQLLGVEVEQEDRDRFIIMTNDLEKVEKLNIYLENYQQSSKPSVNYLKAKEINKIIYEKLGAFLKEQDGKFKTVRKEQHFRKEVNGIEFCLMFAYSDYGFYRYDFILGIHIQEVEDVIKKAN